MAITSPLFNLCNPLPLLRLLPSHLPFLLFRRPCPQLKRVYPSRPFQLFLQQSVYHSVPRGLHLRLEGFGRDEHAEVRLFRYAALHSLVVRVLARIVVDL